jgi:hypothetical protein
MAGLDSLLKYIHDLDSPYKLAGFIAIAFFAGAAALAKKKNIVTKTGFIVLISIIGLIACVAIFASVRVKRTYTVSVVLHDKDRVPYTFDQADVKVNIKTASKDFSSTSDSWTFVFEPDELPGDRAVTFSAMTNDSKSFSDTLIRLTEDPIQSIALTLDRKQKHDIVPPPSFSINLADTTIRRDILDQTGYMYDPGSARNKIVVTYDPGNIVTKSFAGTFYFARSCPIVKIDGTVFRLENCFIPESAETTVKQRVRDYADRQSIEIATSFLRKNPTLLPTWIKSLSHSQ